MNLVSRIVRCRQSLLYEDTPLMQRHPIDEYPILTPWICPDKLIMQRLAIHSKDTITPFDACLECRTTCSRITNMSKEL